MQNIAAALLLLLSPLAAFAFDFDEPKVKTFDESINDVTGQQGYGSVEFYKFELVKQLPTKSVQYGPLDATPPGGTDVIGDATLLGKISDIKFYLIDENGKKLQDITLTPNFDGDHYRGHFTLPARPFRAVAYGKDIEGKKFARVTVKWIHPAPPATK